MNRTLISFLVLGAFAACGGPGAEPAAPEPLAEPSVPTPLPMADPEPSTPPDAGDVSSEPPAEVAWKDMTHEQKVAHMKTKVLPQMKATFQAFDAKHFEKFGCGTCHGPGAKEGKFDMPNPELPKLNAKDNFKSEQKKHPKMTEFMMQKVLPEMAALLGTTPYDPATQQGFGCFGCHTEK